MKKRLFKRVMAYGVVFAVLLQMFSMSFFAAPTTTDTRVVDPSTMTDWQKYFGDTVLNTENAGGVWGDKSVFLNADDFNDALENGVADYDIEMTPDGTNFLVALSAIASNKSIVGYSALPTDTMLVLDLSNSMSDTAMTNMIRAANAAITTLQGLNRNNRVGVVVYSGNRVSNWGDTFGLDESATVMLPIGRYTAAGNGANKTFLTYNNDRVSVTNGVLSLGQGQRNPSQSATGATYIQTGMQLAVDEFKTIDKADTVIADGPQAGTVRMPIMVLMSDGAPTAATTSINNVGNSTHGTGSSSNSTLSYLTQLTCAWAKKEMADHYGRAPLFYTLGLNVGNSAEAQAVLNPSSAGRTYTNYWNAYQEAAADDNTTVTQGSNNSRFTVPVVKGLEQAYVDQYFLASNDNALSNAFEKIVNQIIIQSKYYPTMVEDGQHHLDGYITFHDELGEYMEVREIKGLTVDGNFYHGTAIGKAIKEGAMGNIYNAVTDTYNLNNLNDEGVAFLDAIEERLGCTQEQARDIAEQALASKQIHYESDADFSNYIGWYADANGAFLGFWNGEHTHLDAPASAVYANKSYGFMGTVGSAEEFNESDMLHISVQVRENMNNQHQLVIYKIPAVLIPTVNYNIEFEGDDLETGTNFEMSIDGANEALRLIFEVGLRSDINRINVADKVQDGVQVENGVYTFYSNRWHEHEHTADALVDDHSATWLEFEPSLENERYYFTANTPIYEDNGDGTYSVIDYDPATVSKTYYSRMIRFSTASVATSAAVKEDIYLPITAKSLTKAREDQNGTWYIPKDTIHHLLENSDGTKYQNVKDGENLNTAAKEHPTKTLNYSNYPQVVTLSDGSIHCDACLGNNGTFTMEAAEGIKLSKSMAVAGLGADETFTFEIALSGAPLDDVYPVYDENGEYLYDADVENGVIEIQIKADETVFIADLPIGADYTVTEILPVGSRFMVNNAQTSGTTGTVAAHTFNAVHFVNNLATYGNLVLHKDVFLPTVLGIDASYDGEFDVRVAFEGNITSVKVDGVTTPVTNNTLDLKIKDGQAIVIADVPNNTPFTVSEPNLPSFWQSSVIYQDNRTTISDTAEAVVMLENYYEYSGVEAVNVDHLGIKELTGRGWLDTDQFDFKLQYFDGNNWVDYGSLASVVGSAAEKTFSFDAVIESFVETHVPINGVGTYQLRVVEENTEIGGVTTDIYPKQFALTVENDFESGTLKIVNVTTNTPRALAGGTTVVFNNATDTWEVTTEFVNNYGVLGTAPVEIEITKQLDDYTGLNHTKAGFEFEMYQLDGNGQKINVEKLGTTDASGKLVYRKAFGADLVGERLTYYIAEVDQGENGMNYDLTPRSLEIEIVDNLDGSVSANINGRGNVYAVTFLNTYHLGPATLTVEGNKNLTGRDPQSGDRFNFVLSKTDANFENPEIRDSIYQSVGVFELTDTITVGGTYYYTVTEGKSYLGGITDDPAIYYLTVQVGAGDDGNLKAVITSVKKGNDNASDIEFVNVYKATGNTEITFGIDKTMDDNTGLDRGEAGFRFEMYQLDGNNQKFDVIDLGVTDANGELSYTKTWTPDDVGKTFTYYIAEVDEGEDGVGYDLTPRKFVIDIVDNLNGTISAKVEGVPVGWQGAVFQNTYRLDPATLTVDGNKMVTGRDPLSTDRFTFELYRTDSQFQNGDLVDDVTVANGNFTLADEIAEVGTYYYTVSEVASGIAGITDDTAVYYLTVTVDKGEGDTLKATVTSLKKGNEDANEIAFENVYKATATELTFKGTKELKGGTLKDGDFTFKLYETDDTYSINGLTALDEVKNENGKFTFATIDFTAVGTYYYAIVEDATVDPIDGVVYDGTQYNFRVDVTDAGDGQLKVAVQDIVRSTTTEAAATQTVEVGFVNAVFDEVTGKEVYKKDTTTLIDGQKVVGGDVLTYVIFYKNYTGKTVTLEIADTIPAHTTYVDGSANNGGTFADGKLTWTLQVKAGETAEVSFDVKVNEEEMGTLTNTAEVRDGVNEYDTNTVENPIEEPPVDIPDTGEGNNLFAWLAIAFVSGVCLLGTAKRKTQATK